MNYDKIMEIHWKCHTRAKRQQCVDPEYLMDFAKMVAKECADIAYEYDAPKMSGPGMIIAGRIKEHFGVEE